MRLVEILEHAENGAIELVMVEDKNEKVYNMDFNDFNAYLSSLEEDKENLEDEVKKLKFEKTETIKSNEKKHCYKVTFLEDKPLSYGEVFGNVFADSLKEAYWTAINKEKKLILDIKRLY